jgi:transcriptional regulator with XRE-family HTH domain
MSTQNSWKNVGTRLEGLKESLTLTWGELSKRLQISRAMLDFMRTGDRHPSPKMLRRIMELETEAGLTHPVPSPMMVRESQADYSHSVDSKHLHITELKRQVAVIERQLAELKRTIEESEHAHD